MTETREVYQQRRHDVADKILTEQEHFNMAAYVRGVEDTPPDADPMCGTTLCIAGWAALQIPGTELVRDEDGDVDIVTATGGCYINIAAEAEGWLGLDNAAAESLFYGHFGAAVSDPYLLHLIPPAEAVAALMAAPYITDES